MLIYVNNIEKNNLKMSISQTNKQIKSTARNLTKNYKKFCITTVFFFFDGTYGRDIKSGPKIKID